MDKNDKLFEQAKTMLDAYLTARRMRKTRERYELLRAVCCMTGVFTMDDLVNWLPGHCPLRLSRSTVYGCMDLFVDADIVMRHVHFRPLHYEVCMAERPRIYLVCEGCGCVQTLSDAKSESAILAIRSRRLTIRQRLLYLTGVCKKCEAAQRKDK